jgi:hypothetical protein
MRDVIEEVSLVVIRVRLPGIRYRTRRRIATPAIEFRVRSGHKKKIEFYVLTRIVLRPSQI